MVLHLHSVMARSPAADHSHHDGGGRLTVLRLPLRCLSYLCLLVMSHTLCHSVSNYTLIYTFFFLMVRFSLE